jgi:sarcosine oxidase
MSATPFDVIVVGVGAMGSSACYQLARRGLKVLGLEQFQIAHNRGSSHGQSRMIRMAYYEHPDYVPLLRRAYELWDELEAASGQKLLFKTGGVYLGPPEGGLIAGSLAAARQHGLAHEMLSPERLRERFPQFRIPPEWIAVHEPMAGFLLPEAVVMSYAELARRQGAEIHEEEAVLEWSSPSSGTPGEGRGGGSRDDVLLQRPTSSARAPSLTLPRSTGGGDELLIVRTSRGEYLAKHLIVCGGAWSGKLLADLGVPLLVTRQVLGWVTPRDPQPFALGIFPVWAAENPDGTLQYGFPVMPGEQRLKVAWHGPGSPTDPDAVDRATSGADAATFLPSLPHLLPGAVGPVAKMCTCLYTNSPDHHFIIDRYPRDPRITVACGFSGHGFKFASVVGEILADLAIRGQTSMPAAFLGLQRFVR